MGGTKIPSFSAVHVRGVDHVEVDYLSSQLIHQGEWEFNPKVFSLLCRCLGMPEMDLFAHSGKRFFSLARERGSEGVDTFGPGLEFPPGLCLSPLSLILIVVQKLSVHWQTDFSRSLVAQEDLVPTLGNWSACPPELLPERQDLLLLQDPVCHPNPGFFKLTAWLLKGRACGRGGVQRE